MAAELVMAGPGQPVTHRPHHDLESLFYVLLGICVFYDRPYHPKPEAQLAKCFDKYFNTFKPSLLKTITIQSDISWKPDIVSYISPYFRPLLPLLEHLCAKIILPMKGDTDRSFHSDELVTHVIFIEALVSALTSLDASHWIAVPKPRDNGNGFATTRGDASVPPGNPRPSKPTNLGPARVSPLSLLLLKHAGA
ncbi:hypothetical protein PAXINDRAFT_21191 [Paxillus involutus ATCC 200175]|uniref:Uncharacterized protein n=1 Tax=Paxillus involutus ATCC 200175 TaxID=664439 RepID=A0A0C9TEC3_PAXIN|nr:hypothetical protein PAXINDRAFT_21191 [Paxillus involutus ATCC 200175]